MPPCGTCYSCPGGEDHLKRRSSSPPVPPLLGCRHCSPEPRLNCHAPAGYRNATHSPASQGAKPHSGHLFGRDYKCRKQSNARGAGGGAPGKIKLESPPSRREGGWGVGGNKALIWKKKAGDHPPAPPLRVPAPQVQPVPPPAQARGCKGRSPLHKKTKNLPLPRRGRGAGG